MNKNTPAKTAVQENNEVLFMGFDGLNVTVPREAREITGLNAVTRGASPACIRVG